jgi:hypothetical protein
MKIPRLSVLRAVLALKAVIGNCFQILIRKNQNEQVPRSGRPHRRSSFGRLR